MSLELKAKSNLKANPDFALNDKEIKSGFVGIYLNSARLNPTLFMRLWLSQMSPAVNKPEFAKSTYGRKSGVKLILKSLITGSIRMEKKEDHFLVSVPLATISPNGLSDVIYALSVKPKGKRTDVDDELEVPDEDAELDEEVSDLSEYSEDSGRNDPQSLEEINEISEHLSYKFGVVDGLRAISDLGGIPAQVKAALTNCLVQIETKEVGSLIVAFATFRLTKSEAQYMSNTAWAQIRPIDLYSIMQAWAMSYYGASKNRAAKPPKVALPISTISRGIPVDRSKLTLKTNTHSLSIGGDGSLLYIPYERLDQTSRYEDLFIQAGTKDDTGIFRLVDVDGGIPKNHLPINHPVLIDWVNSKFSYTNTSGLLTVMDLTRNQPANTTHINTFLNRKVDTAIIKNILRLGGSAQIGTTLKFETSDWMFINSEGDRQNLPDFVIDRLSGIVDPGQYYTAVESFLKSRGDDEIRYKDLSFISRHGILRPLGRMFRELCIAIIPRLLSVYEQYSIQYVTHNLGWLVLIYEYSHLSEEIDIEDRTNRSAAINQSEDPTYQQESLPLINPKVGRLPHQRKVANLLRNSPSFAILPVQAGGGKSMIAITDILLQLKKGVGAPYLMLCPSHLISNYVKEITFFTKGRLNVIAINSYTIAKNGIQRLTRMVQNAPRNTVVVSSYDALSLQRQQVCYGTSNIVVYPVVDVLRQFDFGYVVLDESHYVKNLSNRTKATLSLISDIKMKRLMSGTMAHDSPSDLAQQIAMLDPTLFGTRDEFNERFGEVIKGGRVIEWKLGAQAEILNLIKSRVVVAGAQRKEWAALLPPVEERFLRVSLTAEQQRIYNIILNQAIDEIKADSALMQRMNAKPEEGEEHNEEEGEDLAEMLKPYLQRMERYISAPGEDPLGKIELRGQDLVSPKVALIDSILNQHFNSNIPGKVIVFTNYVISAEAIYNNLSPQVKAQVMLYKADSKTEDLARFDTDNSVKAMIGVEDSMNTGLNLQSASRLVRVEAVWSPGTLEQGNSRINRPNLKVGEERESIYYDWIVADNTIDVTKISRLVSKIISVAKFDNAADGTYESLPDLPIIKMNLDSLINLNDWNSTLAEYAQAYAQYQRITEADYAKYREQFIKKYGTTVLEDIPEQMPAPDMKLMSRVPYVQGLELFGEDQLGLMRLDLFMRSQDLSLEIANFRDNDDESVDDDDQSLVSQMMKGRIAHTEFGDGEITKISMQARRVWVRFEGKQSPFPWSAVFVETRDSTSGKDIRTQLLKSTGDLPIDTEIDVPARALRQVRVTKREIREREKEKQLAEQELQAQMHLDLSISVTNGFLGIVYYPGDSNEVVGKTLEALGFRPTEQFYYAHIRNALMLKRQIELWSEKGFEPDPDMSNEMNALSEMWKLLKERKLQNGMATFRLANRNQLRNFYRMEHKPNSDQKLIRPYPLIEDNEAYLVLPIRGQVGTKRAVQVKAPGIRWQISDPSLTYYALTSDKIGAMIRKIQASGLTITNVKDLHKQYKQLKRMKVRDNGVLEV